MRNEIKERGPLLSENELGESFNFEYSTSALGGYLRVSLIHDGRGA